MEAEEDVLIALQSLGNSETISDDAYSGIEKFASCVYKRSSQKARIKTLGEL